MQLTGHLVNVLHYNLLPILCFSAYFLAYIMYIDRFNGVNVCTRLQGPTVTKNKLGSTSARLPFYGREMPAKRAWDIKVDGYYQTDTNNGS